MKCPSCKYLFIDGEAPEPTAANVTSLYFTDTHIMVTVDWGCPACDHNLHAPMSMDLKWLQDLDERS